MGCCSRTDANTVVIEALLGAWKYAPVDNTCNGYDRHSSIVLVAIFQRYLFAQLYLETDRERERNREICRFI